MHATHSVALDNCNKVYVERDYSHGLEVKFQRTYLAALDGLVAEDDWYYTIDTINKLFEVAEAVDAGSVGETLLGFFSCYIVRLCMKTRYEKKLAEIRKFIEDQNRKVFVPAGLCMTDPVERGFRVLELNILMTGVGQSPDAAAAHAELASPTHDLK